MPVAKAPPLGLTRDVLASFLKTHENIKQFENLFRIVESMAPDAIGDVSITADNAQATANAALAQLTRIADALEVLSTAPAARNDNSVATDYIDFPAEASVSVKERRASWNLDDGTLDVGLYNNEVLQIGQEVVYYAKNNSGGLITKGTPVMYDGAVGASGKLKFTKAIADGSVDSDYMMGVAMHDVAANAFGYITHFGLVRGFNTTGTPYGETWADGDLLYFSPTTPGNWTKNQPAAPNINVHVAVVVNASAGSGSIFVRMEISERLKELQDVNIASVSNFDVLVYNSAASRWENNPASAVQVLAWVET